jgi:hypothetical protein
VGNAVTTVFEVCRNHKVGEPYSAIIARGGCFKSKVLSLAMIRQGALHGFGTFYARCICCEFRYLEVKPHCPPFDSLVCPECGKPGVELGPSPHQPLAEVIKMPYRSKAQRGKLHAMAARGEISSKTVKEFDRASKGKKLPARAHRKGKTRR